MSEEDKMKRAKEQARANVEGIVAMVKRLEHCDDCDGDEDCELTDEEIYAGLNLSYTEGDKATDEEKEQYHDRDKASE